MKLHYVGLAELGSLKLGVYVSRMAQLRLESV